jgi:hypothetical protein
MTEVADNNAEPITWSQFLESAPPNRRVSVVDLCVPRNVSTWALIKPDLQLYCNADSCNGIRFFAADGNPHWVDQSPSDVLLDYMCRNCGKSIKTYAVRVMRDGSGGGLVTKIGEAPAFGPPVPAKLISMIGPDREIFLRGRRAENQGLGIGAFAYYRRVVENQKNRLIEQMKRVAQRLGASDETLVTFDQALKETQFSKAVSDLRGVMPQTLLIDGHNPLTLLHSALSEGIHAKTDEECLQIATSIRVVLGELSERIEMALKDEQELRGAISRLMRPRT